ncbi:MAG: transporter substrate-binding domain-containing protein [Clostridia bacterium]|nr:transporter substrate-binding domain-containing protein [Clostridia bacterium]MBQ9880884.1 transporter substrate-binding domain-containing protein [Clostridia bacterium]MCR5689821.1 transporter substrate-binding domain-containing protein [Clostridiales bacterium]
MATNATFPPYEYVEGEDATILGIDAELAALIAEKLGLTLRIENVEFDSIIGGVQTGKYDMGMAGMTVTEERLQNVNFSTPYTTAVQSVIVKGDSAITSIDDIVGDGSMKIGVQQGTTGAIYAEDDYGAENIINYKNGPDAVQALLSGKVDCVIIDNEPAKAYVASVG